MSELFIIATQNKFRFDTVKGLVTVEDLWDMPLNGNDFSLNKVAKDLSKQINAIGEEDFVNVKIKKDEILEQKFTLVKFIIEVKLKAAKYHADSVEQKGIRDKARKILAERKDAKFSELSDKELKKLAK